MRTPAAAFLALTLLACSNDPAAMPDPGPPESRTAGTVEPLPPPAPGEGFQMTMKATAAPGEEILKCRVFHDMPFDTDRANIQRAETRQNSGLHHMVVMSLALTGLDIPPGDYDCDDLYTAEDTEAIMTDSITLVASLKAEEDFILPKGIVAQVPKRSLWMQELHFVNTSDEPVEVVSYVNAYTVPDSEVTATIWGGAVRDRHLNVPARTRDHVEWSRCVMTADADIIFLSSHTHELGDSVEVRFFDGEKVQPEVIYENPDWHAPFLKNFTPGLHVKAGQGFEWRCNYKSDRETDTHWGLTSQDEMCQIALVYTPGDPGITCNVVETSDGVIHQ